MANFMISTKCESCGVIFNTYSSFIKKGGGRFCSNLCRGKWLSKTQIGNHHPNWHGGLVEIKCMFCGVGFNLPPAAIKQGKGKFCSRKCLSDYRSTFLTGENSPQWKGGGTTLQFKIRGTQEYRIWRHRVFKRDNYTCRKCGSRCGNGKRVILHAHHLKPLSLIIGLFRKNFPLLSVEYMAMKSKDLWDINNGITLCRKCHKDEHKKKIK